ncbi:DNA-binding transcription factor yap1 [Mortierella sp. AD011]|nr:DNA-binding transcription factor yap1 [Mortierella sp. AD010]KAF9401370.1 DNA-binding transcription factor yap1 [Mortierella sp. AD011]
MSFAPSQPALADQPEFDRSKRPYPGTSPSENAHEEEEEDFYNPDEDHDNNSIKSLEHPTADSGSRDPSAQPPLKARKKPGRKPNPASPAVRKEQNRAAQRAFRDRKERHLQQLENMIKELKDTHHNATARFQRESQQLKGIIESLQSENYYLREVVFSFESALGKTGNAALLQEVKVELYRRHYESHTARKISIPSAQHHPSPTASSFSIDSPILPSSTTSTPSPAPAPAPVSMPGPVPVDDNIPHSIQVQMLNQALSAAMAAHATTVSANSSSSPAGAKATFVSNTMPMNNISASTSTSTSTSNAWTQLGLADPQDDTIFSMNNDVLYKSAPMFASSGSDDGKTNSTNTVDPVSAARANLAASANWLSKQTYDDLQATLFPQTNTSTSANNNSSDSNIKMSSASPQNMTSDSTLFGQFQDQNSFSPNQNIFTFSAASMDTAFPNQTNSFLDTEDVDSNEFTMATPNLTFEDTLKQDILPSYRLQMELRILASAPPATDPSIDPKIYAMPHDSRIDLIPCPKLRAKMIIHQNEYNVEELCQLLLGGAICHGHPLDPHNWELPRAFFDRYGYLMGAELMKYKNKVWPKKTEPLRQNMFRNF